MNRTRIGLWLIFAALGFLFVVLELNDISETSMFAYLAGVTFGIMIGYCSYDAIKRFIDWVVKINES
jgi:succinate-acetate transporter protein